MRLIARGLKAVGLAAGDLKAAAKGDPRKIAIDGLVHRAIILEFDGQSHRVKKAARSAEKAAADLPASPHRKQRGPPLSPGVNSNCRWTNV